MFRKTLFITTFAALLSLTAAGIALKKPAGVDAKTASDLSTSVAVPQAATCTAPIENIRFDFLKRLATGGSQVAVSWNAPSLPSCISVSQYRVKVALKFPTLTREHEEIVPGNKTSAQFVVRGFVLDTTPQRFDVKITADLKTNASASGNANGQINITP